MVREAGATEVHMNGRALDHLGAENGDAFADAAGGFVGGQMKLFTLLCERFI